MSSDESALLRIGVVAELAGKRASSIRYYEEIGLLPKPVRIGGRRMYDSAIVRTLTVIEIGQRAGLTLEEIKALLAASAEGSTGTQRLREIAEGKLPEIAALIERAERVRGWLECATRCECPSLDACPLFEDSPRLPRDEHSRRPRAPAR